MLFVHLLSLLCLTFNCCYAAYASLSFLYAPLFRCECLPFRHGRGCIDVCAAVGDEEIPRCGKGVCLHDSTQPHGYNCDCSSSFPYGKGPEGVCDKVFPGSLKSYCSPGFYNYPHCTPCRCDWSGTDTGICSLTNGTCLCKVSTSPGTVLLRSMNKLPYVALYWCTSPALYTYTCRCCSKSHWCIDASRIGQVCSYLCEVISRMTLSANC